MTQREENAKELVKQLVDIFEEKEELSHMTGDFELCGKTADDVLREIKDREHTK